MPAGFTHTQVLTPDAPAPLPVYSQAIICNGMVYCSGQVPVDPATKTLVEGGIAERTVSVANSYIQSHIFFTSQRP